MRSKGLVVILVAGATALSGCAGLGPQEQTGMVVGGALGGLVGSTVGRGHGQIAATILGTMVGAAIGGSIGRSMDETDRLKTAAALEDVRTGVPSAWRNPDTGYEYSVTPTRTYESETGPCREYTIDAIIGGKKQKVYGTACRQADGSWKNVS